MWPCLQILNWAWPRAKVKLQLHDAIYRLRVYSNSLTHILSLSNSKNNVASLQKNRGDKSHRVIVALRLLLTQRFLTFRCVPCVKVKDTDNFFPLKKARNSRDGNRELKHTDAAAERRRSHSNLYSIKSD